MTTATADFDPSAPADGVADAPVTDTFRDMAGREWRVRLTLGVLTAVRKATGVSLGDVMQKPDRLAEFLCDDPVRFGQVVWCCVEADAAARGVTADDFYAAFDGSTLEAAGEAVLVAVVDFFPRSAVGRRIRGNLRAALNDVDREMADRAGAALSTSRPSAGGSAASPG